MLLIKEIISDFKLNIRSGFFSFLILFTYRIGSRLILFKGVSRWITILFYMLVYAFHRFLCLIVGCSIPFSANIGRNIKFQHGFYGVFISSLATIEDDCIILHHVTIGSNISYDKDKVLGAPLIKKGSFIGVGARIIGPLVVGEYAKIGANCLVVHDVPKFGKCLAPLADYKK